MNQEATLYDIAERAEMELALENTCDARAVATAYLPFVVSGVDYVKEIETAYKAALLEEHDIRMAVMDALNLHGNEAARTTPIVDLVKALATDHATLKALLARKDAA